MERPSEPCFAEFTLKDSICKNELVKKQKEEKMKLQNTTKQRGFSVGLFFPSPESC